MQTCYLQAPKYIMALLVKTQSINCKTAKKILLRVNIMQLTILLVLSHIGEIMILLMVKLLDKTEDFCLIFWILVLNYDFLTERMKMVYSNSLLKM